MDMKKGKLVTLYVWQIEVGDLVDTLPILKAAACNQ